MKILWQDLRYSLRQLRRAPGFACLAIITLALGIGANIAMYTVIDSVLIRPLPYSNADELTVISSGNDISSGLSSWTNLQDLRTQSSLFSNIAGFFLDTGIIESPSGGLSVTTIRSTSNLPDLLGLRPGLGRLFLPADTSPGAAPVVVLGHTLWWQSFGGNPGIIGQQVRIGEVPHTIIGVMPESLQFFFGANFGNGVWMPVVPATTFSSEQSQAARLWFVLGRLRQNASRNSAQSEVSAIAARIRNVRPKDNADLSYRVLPLKQAVTTDVRPALLALMGALGLVLFIACANVANLQLARCLRQQQEIGVRVALGARPIRLLRQFLSAGAVLSFLGSAAGLGLAALMLKLIPLFPSEALPRAQEIHLRPEVLAFLMLVIILSTLLSSLVPAITATRTDPQSSLAGVRSTNTTRARSRLSSWLVGGEVALATILLIAAGLMFRTLWKLGHLELHFNTTVTMFTATSPQSAGTVSNLLFAMNGKISPGVPVAPVYSSLLQAVRAMPGVREAALSSAVPLFQAAFHLDFSMPGQQRVPNQEGLSNAELHLLSGKYAHVMGIPLVKGRTIEDDDTEGRLPVAVVNEAFVKRYFPGQEPIGQRIILPLGDRAHMMTMFTVVGVLHDVPQMQLTQGADPEIDVSYQQVAIDSPMYPLVFTAPMNFVADVQGGMDFISSTRHLFERVAPGFAADNFRTLESAVQQANAGYRLGFGLVSAFGGLAVILVWAGLYGVLSQVTAQRRQEIGLRMALGATRQSVFALILKQGARLTGLGLAVGVLLAVFTSKLLRTFLYGVTPLDAWTYMLASIAIAIVGLGAVLVPAWRAASVQPMSALRTE